MKLLQEGVDQSRFISTRSLLLEPSSALVLNVEHLRNKSLLSPQIILVQVG